MERDKKHRAYLFRWRWLLTLVDIFGLFVFGHFLLSERERWPSLLHVHTWLHPYSGSGLPIGALTSALVLFNICYLWQQVERHKREQMADAQQQQMRDAANAPGVWPPPPRATP